MPIPNKITEVIGLFCPKRITNNKNGEKTSVARKIAINNPINKAKIHLPPTISAV